MMPPAERSNTQAKNMVLERLARAIDTCQAVHNDSKTPRDQAINLMDHIRALTDERRKLREAAFASAATKPEYAVAVAALKLVNDTMKSELATHQDLMKFIGNVAKAVTAVADLAVAVAGAAG